MFVCLYVCVCMKVCDIVARHPECLFVCMCVSVKIYTHMAV